MGVEQKLHRSTGRVEAESPREVACRNRRRVGYNYLDAMLPLELVDRLKPKALARLVRHEIESWASVAGDNKRLAPSTSRASSVKRCFASRIDTVFIPQT